MKRLLGGVSMLVLLAGPAWAAPRTVTLSVPGMNCAACPITVKKALGKVAGVLKSEVDLEKREVTVTFEASHATVESLTNATRDAGFPSTLVRSAR